MTRKRVWFAEPLLSATEDEVRRLITKAKQWAESLGTPVGLWMSDKQEAFVKVPVSHIWGRIASGPGVEIPFRESFVIRCGKPESQAEARLNPRG